MSDPAPTDLPAKRKPGRPRKEKPTGPPVYKLFEIVTTAGDTEVYLATSFLYSAGAIAFRDCGRIVKSYAAHAWVSYVEHPQAQPGTRPAPSAD